LLEITAHFCIIYFAVMHEIYSFYSFSLLFVYQHNFFITNPLAGHCQFTTHRESSGYIFVQVGHTCSHISTRCL